MTQESQQEQQRQEGKSWRRRLLEVVLRMMAKSLLHKYQPIIIGVTGSIGKTSTKEAIALVVGTKFSVRKNEENYNNEIGIPLTIIGVKSGKHSVWKWFLVVVQWLSFLLLPRKYPKVLVLEMGVDRPGDMQYLLEFVPVQIGVLTHVSDSHLEYFGSLENIATEKGLVLTRLPKDGVAIVNADNEYVVKIAKKVKRKRITYGFGEEADVSAGQIGYANGGRSGLYFRLNHSGTSLPIRLPQVVAKHHIPAVLAAVSVGLALKLNLVDIAGALEMFASLPGRLRLLEGVRRTQLLDDTYNSSPASLRAAFETLGDVPATRRMAVLGDMLELGTDSDAAHEQVGAWVMEYALEQTILVGPRMLQAYEFLKKKGWNGDRVRWFENPTVAGIMARESAQPGDVILVKGSQGMRMEKAVEELLADPVSQIGRLCRQSKEWHEKPFVMPY